MSTNLKGSPERAYHRRPRAAEILNCCNGPWILAARARAIVQITLSSRFSERVIFGACKYEKGSKRGRLTVLSPV
jgi:hypothetical protein